MATISISALSLALLGLISQGTEPLHEGQMLKPDYVFLIEKVDMPGLVPGYELWIADNAGLPEVFMYCLVKDGKDQILLKPAEMTGKIKIETKEAALYFVRLFTDQSVDSASSYEVVTP